MHAFVEGYRALKILEEFKGDLPTYMPKRSVNYRIYSIKRLTSNKRLPFR